MLATVVTGAPHGAVCAFAQAADSFETIPRPAPEKPAHRAAWWCALTGIGLIAASFPIASLADQRYADYLAETDPAQIEEQYQAARHADQLSSAALLTGEALIVGAVYLRFVRHPHPPRASVAVVPGRCAVSVRF